MKKTIFLAVLIVASGGLSAFAQPAIQSINPPQIEEMAGDHVAFTVNATGNGALSYQWYSNNAPISGQTASNLVLVGIQPSWSANYGVAVQDSTAAVASNSAILTVSSAYLPYYPSNIVVMRIGDGVQQLSGATGNTLYLDQYQTNGAYVSTVMIPDETPGTPYGYGSYGSTVGDPSLLVQGAGADAEFEGQLLLSSNAQCLCFAGYCEDYPYLQGDVTSPGAAWRGLGTVDGFGYYNLAYTNQGAYNGGAHAIRGMISTDGLSVFWMMGGAGAGGIKYANITNTAYATGSGIPPISGSSGTGCYCVALPANGAVVYSDDLASPDGLWFLPSGEPEAASGGGYFNRASFLSEGGSPATFVFSPDYNTVYIADFGTYTSGSQGGGIQRWDATAGFTAGGYTYSYTLPALAGQPTGAFGLAVNFPSNITAWGPGVTGAALFATTFAPSGNSLVEIVDNGANSSPTVITTTGPNQALRGVSPAPSQGPAVIGVNPQPTGVYAGGTAVFTVLAGNGNGAPLTYQWQLNGANLSNGPSPIPGSGATISGAQTAALTIGPIQAIDTGIHYTVIVNNSSSYGAVTSSPPALLSLLLVPASITGFSPATENVTNGGTVVFAVTATGGAPLSYQWSGPCGPLTNGSDDSCGGSAIISGANTSSLTLSNVGAGDTGYYYVTVTNPAPSSTNNSASPGLLTVITPPQFAAAGSITEAGTASAQLHFNGLGGTPYSVWSSTNIALKPITNTWNLVGSGIFSGGADSFPVSASASGDAFFVLTTAAGGLIQNGSFAANASAFNTFPGYLGSGSNPSTITGWTPSGGNMGLNGTATTGAGSPFGPSNGGNNTYVFIQGAGSLSQNLTLIPNTTYRLFFEAAGRAGNTPVFNVQVGDNNGAYVTTGALNGNAAQFSLYSYTFATPATIAGTPSIELANVTPSGDNTMNFTDVALVSVTP